MADARVPMIKHLDGICHVYVDEQWVSRLPKRQSDEFELLTELPDYREATSRLSCQVDFTEELSGIKVTVAADS